MFFLTSRIFELDGALWSRGDFVGIPLEGASLALSLQGNVERTLVLVPTYQDALSLYSDMKILEGTDSYLLEAPPIDELKLRTNESFLRRGNILSLWLNSEKGTLIATPSAIVSPFKFAQSGLRLKLGLEVGRERLINWLLLNGYRKADLVWKPCEFSVRGGIIDIYDPSEQAPVRIEFFDEFIDSIRLFQPRTQRSFRKIEEFSLRSASQGENRTESLEWGNYRTVMVRPQRLEESFYVFLDLYNAIAPDNKRIAQDAYETFVLESSRLLRVRLVQPGDTRVRAQLDYSTPPFFRGSMSSVVSYVKSSLKEGFKVHITSRTLTGTSFPEEVMLHKGISLSGGAVINDRKETWLTDAELFGIEDVAADEIDGGMPIDLETSIAKGQFVIHEKYGACKLLGTSSEKFGGQNYETIILGFADDERLIIPTSELVRLTPWTGDGEPELDSIRSKKWTKAWKKAEAQIEADAQDLLTLYAKRALVPGYPFPRDGELMREFENSFPFKETADQIKAIRDVKKDMERPWPMDRLIVGDVGYGKTEVALRAAVKAVEGGKQVAIVVPTTVLALQHYRTCQARFGDLPVHVELLSRMVALQKQKKTLSDIKEGTVDIVIGTHRLFQGDIKFKDLGLLIIDEEHRFGVKHKEYLKRLNAGLDVLSLSATPIPRSLSMALRGIRDISTIETPPRSRGEVFTVTSEWDTSLAYDAIRRELVRGGQVYYLHNRVSDIDEVAAKTANRFPGHKTAVAHGQLPEGKLEKVMNDFYDGKIEILVCTTIIESGLDVPRANTLIVDDIQRLGLAQMHQIRGRIGRRTEDAYALFFYSKGCSNSTTLERLNAFGSVSSQSGGYQIAQRDLEIRGAGEILGTEQHGFKERIGYTLYLKKLKEKVEQIQGTTDYSIDVEISLPLRIPEDYVPQADLRIGLYRRLLTRLTFKEYEEIKDELRDRYGPIPEQVMGLLDSALARAEGGRAGMTHLKVTPTFLSIEGDVRPGTFRPPRWFHQNGSLVGVGGIKGLSLVAGELIRIREQTVERDEQGWKRPLKNSKNL